MGKNCFSTSELCWVQNRSSLFCEPGQRGKMDQSAPTDFSFMMEHLPSKDGRCFTCRWSHLHTYTISSNNMWYTNKHIQKGWARNKAWERAWDVCKLIHITDVCLWYRALSWVAISIHGFHWHPEVPTDKLNQLQAYVTNRTLQDDRSLGRKESPKRKTWGAHVVPGLPNLGRWTSVESGRSEAHGIPARLCSRGATGWWATCFKHILSTSFRYGFTIFAHPDVVLQCIPSRQAISCYITAILLLYYCYITAIFISS